MQRLYVILAITLRLEITKALIVIIRIKFL